MEKIKIKDESGDKNNFTIIPNYIANHSTAIDQALYFQMKRFAGESEAGKCFATQETLMNKLGIGRLALKKSLDYLAEKGWIEEIGSVPGKTRPVKSYKVNNIWKINSDYFDKKIPTRTAVSFVENKKDTDWNSGKIPTGTAVEEEPIDKDKDIATNVASKKLQKDINELIPLFNAVNPFYERFFSNKSERAALGRIIEKFGKDKASQLIEVILPQVIVRPFAPSPISPTALEREYGRVEAFYKREKNKRDDNKSKVAVIL